ncbi:MAG TPA: DUF4271 domain-containing protein [Chitinophagaceae bacterium]|nr:DUF4271 domain-containing protein [Chitinophagaceae bacterium]
MYRFLITALFFSLTIKTAVSQTNADTSSITSKDSVQKNSNTSGIDSIVTTIPPKNTVSMRPHPEYTFDIDTTISLSSPEFSQRILEHHPYFGFGSKAIDFRGGSTPKIFKGKEIIFYLLILLLLFFALLKNAFPKYFNDLFRVFFRTTLKQKQISEQLEQTPLPSLLLNGFFVISGGLYMAFIIDHYKLNPLGNFWILSAYCCAGLSIIYLLKFLSIKTAGWLFSMSEAADSYIFIVFVINKMIGILILPFLILLAFTMGYLNQAGLVLSYCLIGGMLLYRAILTFATIRNQVKVNPFHFFLYLIAFEIAPLLLIGKVVLEFLSITT